MISKSVAFGEAEPLGQLDEPAAAAIGAELATFGFFALALAFSDTLAALLLGRHVDPQGATQTTQKHLA